MGRMTSSWKTHEIKYLLEWCWRKKLWGCCLFAWYCNKEEAHKYLMETVHCLFILVQTSKQLVSDIELKSQEFSADTYCRVLHPHTQGRLPRLLEVSWGLSLVFSSATRLWLCQRLFGLFTEHFWVSLTVACLIVAHSKWDSKRMHAGTCNAETPISARDKLCFLKLSKQKN